MSDSLSPKYLNLSLYIYAALILGLSGCSPEGTYDELPEVSVLSDYETIISFEDGSLAKPSMLRVGNDDNLFVYDSGQEQVVEITTDGDVINEIGQSGSGPGEYQSVDDIIETGEYINIVDDNQYLIHRYFKDGEYVSSMDYGEIGFHRKNVPAVLDEDVLLVPNESVDHALFQLFEWRGNTIKNLGNIPEGRSDELDYTEYRKEISDQTVPSFFKTHSFAVNDESNPGEFFLVYEAIPKVAKYNIKGELIWEAESVHTPEIDTAATAYYDLMDEVLQQTNAIKSLEKYVDGVGSNGSIFLYVNSSRLHSHWIHEMNGSGDLINRYQIESEVDLLPSMDIDFENSQIVVITEEAEIRAYEF